ncbi:hypothetical protein [Kocuria rhizophila]|uniref:hypothetical protein n=1 Tax=Kocuria rhizophila TaxID=72000 RepID=UPI0011A4A990|nr:hypothetical protein [Kocuria rhizophila]
MSPSSARDPFDDGNAPWTGGHGSARPDSASQDTRPLPRPDHRSGPDGQPGSAAAQEARTAAVPTSTADDAARTRPLPSAPPTGRTGVASGRLHPRDQHSGPANPVGDDHLTHPQERISAEASWDTMRPAVRPGGASAAPRLTAEALRARQRQRFGGLQIVPGLMGLLTAAALGALLTALAILAGPAVGLDTGLSAGDALARAWNEPGSAQLWGGVVVLGAVELLSMLAGGYVAGRMARFSGAAQGVCVWLWSVVARAAASAAVLLWAGQAAVEDGSRWVAQEMIGANPTVGLVAIGGLLVLGLVGAVLGGLWGMYYHRKVDAWSISHAMSQ